MSMGTKLLLSISVSIIIVVILIITVNNKLYSDDSPVYTMSGGTFDMDINVIVTDDTAVARKFVIENLDSTVTTDDFNSRATTFGTKDGSPVIIWLHSNVDVAIINHELLHATVSIMNWAGVPLSDSSEEAYAYEMQYLTNQFYKQVKTKK